MLLHVCPSRRSPNEESVVYSSWYAWYCVSLDPTTFSGLGRYAEIMGYFGDRCAWRLRWIQVAMI